MSILVLSIVLSITLMLGIFIVVLYFQHKGRVNKRAFMFVPLGLLAMLLLLSECFVTIKANEVGIVYDEFGGLQEEVKKEPEKKEKKKKDDKFAHEGGDFLSDDKNKKQHIRGRIK